MNAAQILAIHAPEKIFQPGDLKKRYYELAKQWHPDVCSDPQAQQVFEHINKLHASAIKKLAYGYWGAAGCFKVTVEGQVRDIVYDKREEFEFGEFFFCDSTIEYLFDPKRQQGPLKSYLPPEMKFISDHMRKQLSPCLPMNAKKTGCDSGDIMITIDKQPPFIRLKDLIDKKGKLEARHAAWVMSRLYNIAAYLSFAQMAHNAISVENIYVEPKLHIASLLGGWHFCRPFKTPLDVVPKRTFDILPWNVRAKKIALPHTDLELVRAVGREICNNPPAPMRKWLEGVSEGNAFHEFKDWGTVLDKSFGPKRIFVPFEITADEIYTGG